VDASDDVRWPSSFTRCFEHDLKDEILPNKSPESYENPAMNIAERPKPISDLRIQEFEAIYLRLAEVRAQCDSGQDALIVAKTAIQCARAFEP